MIEEASKMIGEEIPNLMKLMPAEDKDKESDGKTMITGGIFDDVSSVFLLEFCQKICQMSWEDNNGRHLNFH